MLLFGALVLFVAEVVAFVAVGEHVGFGWAVLILLVVSALGPLMIRRAGKGVLLRAQQRLAEGELPTRELLDGVVVLLGGLLVCIPGFITDAIGLLLMVGPVRLLFIRLTGRRVARRIQTLSPRRGNVIEVSGHVARNGPRPEMLESGPRTGA